MFQTKEGAEDIKHWWWMIQSQIWIRTKTAVVQVLHEKRNTPQSIRNTWDVDMVPSILLSGSRFKCVFICEPHEAGWLAGVCVCFCVLCISICFFSVERLVPFKLSMIAFDVLFCHTYTQLLLMALFWWLLYSGRRAAKRRRETITLWMWSIPRDHFWFFNIELQEKKQLLFKFIAYLSFELREFSILFSLSIFQCSWESGGGFYTKSYFFFTLICSCVLTLIYVLVMNFIRNVIFKAIVWWCLRLLRFVIARFVAACCSLVNIYHFFCHFNLV